MFSVIPLLKSGFKAFQTVLSLKLGILEKHALCSEKAFRCECEAMQPHWLVLPPFLLLGHAVLYYHYLLISSVLGAGFAVFNMAAVGHISLRTRDHAFDCSSAPDGWEHLVL